MHVTTIDLQWAIAVYQLTLASLLIRGRRLGDLLARKRMLLAGIGFFGLASLLCGTPSASPPSPMRSTAARPGAG
ncbi:MAG: hypothetical protein ACJ76R_12385 [Solirubrobacteraceae bacterium]